MQDSKSSTIAKNTLMLYLRMAVTMFISLYTSRIVLNALGVDDFGVNNVVGGVIGFFGFIIYSMQTAIQRFLSVAMGKGDMQEVRNVFSIGIFIHIIFSLFVLILGETVGLWFLENKLVIPEGRENAAFWIYQFAIVGTISSLMSIPYTAEVVAHEKMGTFAYLSILNVFLSFGIANLLLITPYDRLITSGFLGLCATLLNVLLYYVYCKKNFPECRFTIHFPKDLLKEMTSFAGWDFFGVVAYCVSTQGATIMLNMFFGPAVNAARAVAQTALEKVKSFSNNFTVALNPAISKAYGRGDIESMKKYMYSGSKLIFFLLFSIAFPVFLKAPFLLELWLGNVPDYTVAFVRILLVQSVILTMWNPLFTAGLATGRIKEFGFKTSVCNILKMPICYLLLIRGCSPVIFILMFSVLELLSYSLQLFTMKSILKFDYKDYFYKVQGKSLAIMVLTFPLPCILSNCIVESILGLMIIGVITTILSIFSCYFVLLDKFEKQFVKSKLLGMFK